MTQPSPVPVEVTSSYARRDGDAVALFVDVPDLPPLVEPTGLRLRNGKRVVRADVEGPPGGAGGVWRARVPAQAVPPGVWRLQLETAPGRDPVRLQARLVVGRRQPVALLTGPMPSTRLPVPAPRHPPRAATRARSAAVAVVDRVLAPLPAARATRYRSALRTAARRVTRH